MVHLKFELAYYDDLVLAQGCTNGHTVRTKFFYDSFCGSTWHTNCRLRVIRVQILNEDVYLLMFSYE